MARERIKQQLKRLEGGHLTQEWPVMVTVEDGKSVSWNFAGKTFNSEAEMLKYADLMNSRPGTVIIDDVPEVSE